MKFDEMMVPHIATPKLAVILTRGQTGYAPIRWYDTEEDCKAACDKFNARNGEAPTAEQVEAFEAAAMFGWDIPFAAKA